MIRIISHLRTTARQRRAERQFHRAWDRAIDLVGSDSHLEEINEIFAKSVA
jgi:hypothetical protein